MGFDNLWLELDPLSRVFVAAFLLVGVPCLLYLFSMQKDVRLVVASVAFLSAALGVVAAPDFLRFLIFWELTVLTACYLIARGGRTGSAKGGNRDASDDPPYAAGGSGRFTARHVSVAYRYFLVQIVAGTSLFFAIAVQYAMRGSFAMDAVAPEAVPFFLIAFLIKAAIVPFHLWVPLTYPCVPPAVAVVLSAFSTKVGVYAFARVLPGIPWVAYAGGATALFGVAMALRQKSARRLLSYHLVSQVGYMIAGIGVGTELGIGAGTLHMLNNMMYKSLLFMAAGAVMYRQGTDVLARVHGAARSMPVTFVTALVGAAAISGLPPLNGYLSKTLLKTATEGHPMLQAALLLAGVGTAFSFAKFIWYLFVQKPTGVAASPTRRQEAPLGACLAMGMLAVFCLGQFVFYRPLFERAFEVPAGTVFGWNQMLLGAAPVLAGVALFRFARGNAAAVVRPVGAQAVRFVASSVAPESPGRSRAPESDAQGREEPPDVDRLYGWLLRRALGAAQRVARRATDETQAYLLIITALLLAFVAFLWS